MGDTAAHWGGLAGRGGLENTWWRLLVDCYKWLGLLLFISDCRGGERLASPHGRLASLLTRLFLENLDPLPGSSRPEELPSWPHLLLSPPTQPTRFCCLPRRSDSLLFVEHKVLSTWPQFLSTSRERWLHLGLAS